jgi:hypothetical protein
MPDILLAYERMSPILSENVIPACSLALLYCYEDVLSLQSIHPSVDKVLNYPITLPLVKVQNDSQSCRPLSPCNLLNCCPKLTEDPSSQRQSLQSVPSNGHNAWACCCNHRPRVRCPKVHETAVRNFEGILSSKNLKHNLEKEKGLTVSGVSLRY